MHHFSHFAASYNNIMASIGVFWGQISAFAVLLCRKAEQDEFVSRTLNITHSIYALFKWFVASNR